MTTPLQPASAGYDPLLTTTWHSGLSCPSCHNEMVAYRVNGEITVACTDDSHPIVQLSPDGTIHRATEKAETR